MKTWKIDIWNKIRYEKWNNICPCPWIGEKNKAKSSFRTWKTCPLTPCPLFGALIVRVGLALCRRKWICSLLGCVRQLESRLIKDSTVVLLAITVSAKKIKFLHRNRNGATNIENHFNILVCFMSLTTSANFRRLQIGFLELYGRRIKILNWFLTYRGW